MSYVRELKAQLREGALAWQEKAGVPWYRSKGNPPTILFPPDGARHGNFFDPAWSAINADLAWQQRLEKRHSQTKALPDQYQDAQELDSSNSSDALLMNFFCPPGAAERLAKRLGIRVGSKPHLEFGYRAGVPRLGATPDATEIDLRFGDAICEAKLTEATFTSKQREIVMRYRDLKAVFQVDSLPQSDSYFYSYQLIRNVLAAAHLGARLFVFVDARRPDLQNEWNQVKGAITDEPLRQRCQLVHWQELVESCDPEHAAFLREKYRL